MPPTTTPLQRQELVRNLLRALHAAEAARQGLNFDTWNEAEIRLVHDRAAAAAATLGMRRPTMEQVRAAEALAAGHSDYAHRWIVGVVDAMAMAGPRLAACS